MTQHEFHLSVTPVGDSRYLIRTERIAPGVPLSEELAVWPVESWLAQAQALMGDPLLGLLRGTPPASAVAASLDEDSVDLSLTRLGQELYRALFSNSVRDSWLAALGIAQHQSVAATELQPFLRLRLGLKGPGLPRLPWEALHDGTRALTMGTDLTFTRYQGTFSSIARSPLPADATQPLRVLMVMATPIDQVELATEREAEQLQLELGAQIQITLLPQPGRADLTRALERGNYQILHYAGHSDLGSDGGSLCLVSNETGLTEFLSGDDLAGLLANNGVRLAVFNSCRSSSAPASQERSLAEALVKRGIPAVLTMAERIPDDVALELSRLFYRNLTQGASVDLSLARARQGLLSSYGSGQRHWVLPVLYMHPEFDGYLIPRSRPSLIWTPPLALSSEPPLSELPVAAAASAPAAEPPAPPLELSALERSKPTPILELPGEVLAAEQPDESEAAANPARRRWPLSWPHWGKTTQAPPTAANRPPVGLRSKTRMQVSLFAAGALTATLVSLLLFWQAEQRGTPSDGLGMPPLPQSGVPPVPGSSGLTPATAERQAIAQMLEQGKLADAEAALTAIPADPQTLKVRPEVNYLWGRLALQGYQQGYRDYPRNGPSVARRNFEQAVEQQPNNALYLNALGVAYYSSEEIANPNALANDAWQKALAAAQQNNNAEGLKNTRFALAGLALSLMRDAREGGETAAVKQTKLAQAVALRDQVLAADRTYANPDSLPDLWLWPRPVLEAWKALLRVSSP